MKKRNHLHAFLPWILPAALVLIWILVSHKGLVPHYLLPAPLHIIKTGYTYIFDNPGNAPYAGRFLGDVGASLARVSLGFSCAVLWGLPLGVLSGRLVLVNRVLSSLINGLRAVPGITWLPLAMVWFGIGIKTTIFLIALAAFFPIYLNAAAGASQVNLKWLQAGAMMGVGRLRSST